MLGCGGCDTTWTGTSRCHCSGCHQTFSGITGFDAHRRRFSCLDPASVGLVQVNGLWQSPEVNPYRAAT